MNRDKLNESSRVALAAYLHDLGKFAERARLPVDKDRLEFHKQQYCPRRPLENGGYHYTHVHAAYTALAFSEIEKKAPALKGNDFSPFGSSLSPEVVDSLVNAAAQHHTPDTFLQWVVATADRVASGFEREEFERYNQSEDIAGTGKNHYQARMLSLFEAIDPSGTQSLRASDFRYRQKLAPMTADSLFPELSGSVEPGDNGSAQKEYSQLWDEFLQGLDRIPSSHRESLPVWFDHFDTLWQVFTHAIPSATAGNTRPDVSLYDHSHTTAALATALWRYHSDKQHQLQETAKKMRTREDWDEEKFLLIQGDLYGIQDFIFAEGRGETQKRAAKLLRGRSLYVSLMTECASLRVLEALSLPSTSQITNAAGKFLILAPNTQQTVEALREVQAELDDWFLKNSYGESGLGVTWEPIVCNDFIATSKSGSGFSRTMKRISQAQEKKKHQAFGLCQTTAPKAVFEHYIADISEEGNGICELTGRGAAIVRHRGLSVSQLAADQLKIGEWVTGKRERLLISRETPLEGDGALSLPLFGYHLYFTDHESGTGKFGREVANGNISRLYDFSTPEDGNELLWHGYARRSFGGYVPVFDHQDKAQQDRYGQRKEVEKLEVGDTKTLGDLACEDRLLGADGHWMGVKSLGILKGDIDNLGLVFQKGLERPSFAKMAALSRQINAFFTVCLPAMCQREEYRNTYIVFAGGDDFFLMGPWRSLMKLAAELRYQFGRYVADNSRITFSVGLTLHKPNVPVNKLARIAEEALEEAKAMPEKNAIHCMGRTVGWQQYQQLMGASGELAALADDHGLPTSYIYSLIEMLEMAEQKDDPRAAMWRSRLQYNTWRQAERIAGKGQQKAMFDQLVDCVITRGIESHRNDYRIALNTQLYLKRR